MAFILYYLITYRISIVISYDIHHLFQVLETFKMQQFAHFIPSEQIKSRVACFISFIFITLINTKPNKYRSYSFVQKVFLFKESL